MTGISVLCGESPQGGGYRYALKCKAEEFGFFTIDASKLPIDPKDAADREKYMFDGVHPNVIGHKMYADLILEEMKKKR